MFEKSDNPDSPTNQRPEIFLAGGEPIEFTYNGQRFRIHTVLSSWRESGGWWNRASDGLFRPDDGASKSSVTGGFVLPLDQHKFLNAHELYSPTSI